MKIAQVREQVKDYDSERLRIIINELYKVLPKKLIEEKGIDDLLKNPEEYVTRRKKGGGAGLPDFNQVKRETEIFIEYAGQDYYFAPNRVVHKKDRPKWRFIVKRLYKDLISSSKSPVYSAEAGNLLGRLYCLMCEACGVYLFSSDDPFHSVGIEQTEFFRMVVAVKKQAGLPEEWVMEAIRLIIDNDVDNYTLTTELTYTLLEFLNTAPLKEKAVELCERLRREIEGGAKKRRSTDYSQNQKNNDLIEMVLIIQMELGEYEQAVGYFKSFYRVSNREVALYALLQWLQRYELKDLWLREYEAAAQQGVRLREELMNKYKWIKEAGEFPGYFG